MRGSDRSILIVLALGVGTAVLPPKADAAPPPTNSKIKVSKLENPGRKITFRGKSLTIKEFMDEVDPNEKITLRDGSSASVQQIFDDLEELEKSLGKRLKTFSKKSVVRPGLTVRLDKDAKAGNEEIARLSKLNLATVSGAVGKMGRRKGKVTEQWAEGPTDSVDDTPPNSPLDGRGMDVVPLGPTNAPTPQREPVDGGWYQEIGDPTWLSVSASAGVGNDFKSLGAVNTVLCGGSGDVELGVFSNAVPLAKMAVNASVSSQPTVAASMKLYILGQSSPVWSKDTKKGNESFSRTTSSPTVSFPLPIWGDLGVKLSLSASATLGLQANADHTTNGAVFSCKGGATPSASANGILKLEPMLGGGVFETFVKKYIKLSINGNLTLLKLKAPASYELSLYTDSSANKKPLKLLQAAQLDLDAEALSGVVTGDVEFDLPLLAEAVAAVLGLDDLSWKFEIFSWGGWTSKEKVFALPSNEIPFK